MSPQLHTNVPCAPCNVAHTATPSVHLTRADRAAGHHLPIFVSNPDSVDNRAIRASLLQQTTRRLVSSPAMDHHAPRRLRCSSIAPPLVYHSTLASAITGVMAVRPIPVHVFTILINRLVFDECVNVDALNDPSSDNSCRRTSILHANMTATIRHPRRLVSSPLTHVASYIHHANVRPEPTTPE